MGFSFKGTGILFVVVVTAVSIWRLADTRELHPAPPDLSGTIDVNGTADNSAPVATQMPSPTDAGPMMLELYSPYCPSCKQMAPLVDQLAGACPGNGVAVHQYDISDTAHEHLVDTLDIEAVPTFLFIDETGTEVSRLVGKQTAETLESQLADIGGAACFDRS